MGEALFTNRHERKARGGRPAPEVALATATPGGMPLRDCYAAESGP